MASRVLVMVATRKGAWLFHGDAARRSWRVDGPHFLGHIVNHLVLDPRDGRTLLAAAKTGHLGPTVFRSTDLRQDLEGSGAAARVCRRPRRARRAARSITRSGSRPATRREPGVWYAGTSPQGLFRSEDGGVTLGAVLGHQRRSAVPRMDGHACRTARRTGRSCTRSSSIRAIPRTCTSRMSGGGVHESTDGGRDLDAAHQRARGGRGLRPRERRRSTTRTACGSVPSNPDRLYQQNHCGIYRLDRPSDDMGAHRQEHAEARRRHRLSDGRAPARCRHRLGVPDGRHAASGRAPARTASPPSMCTRNGGKTWQRLDDGCPRSRLVDREAPGDDGGRARSGRPLLRHDQRRAVDEPRRRREVGTASRGTCRRSTRWKRRAA